MSATGHDRVTSALDDVVWRLARLEARLLLLERDAEATAEARESRAVASNAVASLFEDDEEKACMRLARLDAILAWDSERNKGEAER
jgi:hypothetical protein